ncbi:hypothetical protein BU15DRAFT_62774 [Melanogaster broomeanus]|nr:hypothetical protein BU15DRAFT_62774 [Melanogaster broomeanus]
MATCKKQIFGCKPNQIYGMKVEAMVTVIEQYATQKKHVSDWNYGVQIEERVMGVEGGAAGGTTGENSGEDGTVVMGDGMGLRDALNIKTKPGIKKDESESESRSSAASVVELDGVYSGWHEGWMSWIAAPSSEMVVDGINWAVGEDPGLMVLDRKLGMQKDRSERGDGETKEWQKDEERAEQSSSKTIEDVFNALMHLTERSARTTSSLMHRESTRTEAPSRLLSTPVTLSRPAAFSAGGHQAAPVQNIVVLEMDVLRGGGEVVQ